VDPEDRWELEPRRGRRRSRLAVSAVAAVVWTPLEAALLWLTTAAVVAPFDDYPWFQDHLPSGIAPLVLRFPEDWAAVPTVTFLGALTVFWTSGGFRVARRAIRAGKGEVVVLGPRGIRTERLSRKGSRVVLDLPWEQVREAEVRPAPSHVAVHGTRGSTVIATAGDDDQHRQIERYVTRRVTPEPGLTRPPVLPGWTAYVDDRGATLIAVRDTRKRVVAGAVGGSVLSGVNAVAVAVDPPAVPFAWWAVAILGTLSFGLAGGALDLAFWTPRWIARPGCVVHERRLRGRVVFEARSLEVVRHTGDGAVTYALLAVEDSAGDPTAARRAILSGNIRPDVLATAGAWLARHAEIPFRALPGAGAGS
jgi:hypothetical protein